MFESSAVRHATPKAMRSYTTQACPHSFWYCDPRCCCLSAAHFWSGRLIPLDAGMSGNAAESRDDCASPIASKRDARNKMLRVGRYVTAPNRPSKAGYSWDKTRLV